MTHQNVGNHLQCYSVNPKDHDLTSYPHEDLKSHIFKCAQSILNTFRSQFLMFLLSYHIIHA
jgi:hypothetical protein